ncbi:hypothetical protein KIW84_010574 [Lathyrus oleraceus]|uniref:CCHC-type domain-containing protein n=1 Tax=Pisum sativum TaxID=3888 RepID=A0A9D4YLK8_PEA|nr:hypothetical protein KIW84_010574 [Pisum sativum]
MTSGQVKFYLRPTQANKVRLRIHHKGKLVSELVKWYVGEEVTEMNWGLDVDFISYMDVKRFIKSEGYVDIECLWYWNPVFSFACCLRSLNNDKRYVAVCQRYCRTQGDGCICGTWSILPSMKSTFEKTCSNIVFPTNRPQLWLIVDHVPIYPPVMRRAIDRPNKLRNKENDESNNPHVLSRRLVTVTCKKCGEMGHNKRSCKGKRVVDRAIPRGGNKTKKEKTIKGGNKAKKEKNIKGGNKAKKVKKSGENQAEIGHYSQAPQAT